MAFRPFGHYLLRRVWFALFVSLHSHVLWEVPQIHSQINTWSWATNSGQVLLKHSVDSKLGKAGEDLLRMAHGGCAQVTAVRAAAGQGVMLSPQRPPKANGLSVPQFITGAQRETGSWAVCGPYNGRPFPLKKCIHLWMINFFLWCVTYSLWERFAQKHNTYFLNRTNQWVFKLHGAWVAHRISIAQKQLFSMKSLLSRFLKLCALYCSSIVYLNEMARKDSVVPSLEELCW